MERRTVIVTGAASGIGKETARRFLNDEKYTVYAIDKDPLIKDIFPASEWKSAVPLEIDIREIEVARQMVREVASRTGGRLDVVVNAAGVMNKGKPDTYIENGKRNENAELMEAVNYYAPIVIMMEAGDWMRRNGGGTIVNITSSKYLFPDPHHIPYQVYKMRLSKVTRGMAKHFRESNIKLVDLQPGNTKTEIDRGVWNKGNNFNDVLAAEAITSWWRRKFGNDPGKVAEVIYKIAEGEIDKKVVRVGLDSQLGYLAYLATYPLGFYRSDYVFYAGSTVFYKIAELSRVLKRK